MLFCPTFFCCCSFASQTVCNWNPLLSRDCSMAALRLDSNLLTWSEELLVECLFPFCPMACILNVLATGRRGSLAGNMVHVRRCQALRDRIFAAIYPALWEGLLCPPFRGRQWPLFRWVPADMGETFLSFLRTWLGVHPRRDAMRTLTSPSAASKPCFCFFLFFFWAVSNTVTPGSLPDYIEELHAANADDEAIHLLAPFLRAHGQRLHWFSPRCGTIFLVLPFTVETFEGAVVVPIRT